MINAFRLVSLFEGISYLLLLFIAVPIKYFQGNESFVKILGMPHGILFIGYIVLLIFIQKYAHDHQNNSSENQNICKTGTAPFDHRENRGQLSV